MNIVKYVSKGHVSASLCTQRRNRFFAYFLAWRFVLLFAVTVQICTPRMEDPVLHKFPILQKKNIPLFIEKYYLIFVFSGISKSILK